MTECKYRKCCFIDKFGRCTILTKALGDNCRFMKESPEKRPCFMGPRKKKVAPLDTWPYA